MAASCHTYEGGKEPCGAYRIAMLEGVCGNGGIHWRKEEEKEKWIHHRRHWCRQSCMCAYVCISTHIMIVHVIMYVSIHYDIHFSLNVIIYLDAACVLVCKHTLWHVSNSRAPMPPELHVHSGLYAHMHYETCIMTHSLWNIYTNMHYETFSMRYILKHIYTHIQYEIFIKTHLYTHSLWNIYYETSMQTFIMKKLLWDMHYETCITKHALWNIR